MRTGLASLIVAAALALLAPAAPPLPAAIAQGVVATTTREAAYRALNAGIAQLEQFAYDPAALAFREALRRDPGLAVARLDLAIALFYGSHLDDAAAEADRAATQLPDAASAHYVRGLIARAADRTDAALAAFTRVLQLDPSDAATRVQLGQIHLQQRRYPDALRHFEDALAAEPYNVTAAYGVAMALTRSGQPDAGRVAMQRFETLRDSAYGVTYSQTYLAQGRYAEAVAATGAEAALVDTAPPAVAFFDLSGALPAAPRPAAPGGAVTLVDADDDGDLEVLEARPAGLRLLRRQAGRFADDTQRAGLAAITGATGALAGDYDNDGRTDLFVLGPRGARLLQQQAGGTFSDVSNAALPAPADVATSAAFADVDHDGDLDIVTVGSATRLLRNNGGGTFTDITTMAGLAAPAGPALAIIATDLDNGRDVDLLVLGTDRPALYRNLRDGTFADAAAGLGLPPAGAYSCVTAADANKDGYPDLFFGRAGQAGLFAMSDGRGRFRLTEAPDATRGASAAQFVDYDNDGLLDLLTIAGGAAHLLRNIGVDRWTDVTSVARLPGLSADGAAAVTSIALGDLDGDGDVDAVAGTARDDVRYWRNDGGNRHLSVRVSLTARVSNRRGIGAKIDVRAGSLRQTIEVASAMPPFVPADVIVGLGARARADVVRVLWTSGILQAETDLPAAPRGRPGQVAVTELDRKPSSCPFLYTWNGQRFEFVTDFLGGGEMGDWLAPSVWNQPDPDEYVRIRGDQLVPREGRYELRVTNELEEALFVDRVQLAAIDHPPGVSVFPNEGLRQPPRPPFRLMATTGARAPRRATDEHGHDVLPLVAALDRRYPDDFAPLAIRGYAAPHALVLDLGNVERPVLLLTGWTDYAFSNDNVAASHAGIEMALPSLQVRDESGAWRTAIEEIGFPVGRPQTVAVDLATAFLSGSREVRILTSMRIYWDQVQVASSLDAVPRLTRVEPLRADLRWRGFSSEVTPDGREPYLYDYTRVSTIQPWKALVGRYTREGDVRPLLRGVDDRFVVSRPGDELALSFDAGAFPRLAAGWTRTFLLYAHGYSKEMNPRSASPHTLGPLPFRGMSGYPYGPGEHYPRTPAHRDYLDRYNTRVVTRSMPPMPAGAEQRP